MTDNTAKPAREFFIYPHPSAWVNRVDSCVMVLTESRLQELQSYYDWKVNEIPVIEKSAYDQLKEQVARLEAEKLELMGESQMYRQCFESASGKEDQLQSQLAWYKEQCEKLAGALSDTIYDCERLHHGEYAVEKVNEALAEFEAFKRQALAEKESGE